MRIRVYLQRVRLDSQGYVRKGQAIQSGTYYGVGAPLYHAYAEWEDPAGTFTKVFRATDRNDAKHAVQLMKSSFPLDARLVFSGRW